MSDLITPNDGETIQEYTKRFMADEDATLAFPSDRDRKMVATYRFSKYAQKKEKGQKRGK